MPQTNRDYSQREVAVLVKGYLPHSFESERAVEGDIIATRAPHFAVGFKEMDGLLWLRVEGLDRTMMDALDQPNLEPLDPDFEWDLKGIAYETYDKRRYCIPLARLKVVAPWLDLARVRDVNDIYQPFIQVDEETGGYIRGTQPPLSVFGLVYDKAMQRFL